MKRLVLFIVASMSWAAVLHAQDCDCYTATRAEGIQLMQKKEYAKAIDFFRAANDCPDKPANNDLAQKMRECQNEIKKLEEQDRLREEEARNREAENRRRAQASDNARKGYMDIQRVSFGNGDKQGNILTDFGGTLYTEDVCYVKPKVYYRGLASENKSVELKLKIYNPDGSLRTGTSSPSGYTYSDTKTVYPGNSQSFTLLGFGSETAGTYSCGTYRYEIWYDGNRLYSTTFEIKSRSGTASRLTVDSKTAVSTSFSAGGGTETFYVSTDASSWTTWGVPSWCSIEEKTSNSFTLRCAANTSSSSRSDYMKVKAGDKEVRIDISQAGSGSQSSRLMDITRVTYANVDKQSNILNDYGSTLYTDEVRFVRPKVYYKGLVSGSKSVELKMKIYNPDGTLSSGSSSPSGYSWSETKTIYSGDSQSLTLLGWGSETGSTYSKAGTYRLEIWYEGNKLYSSTFEVRSRSVSASRLTVNDKTAVTTSFSASGGTQTFYVSTDASTWTTWGVPSWCSIEEKTSTSFRLRCTANTTSSSRKDYMKVKAGDKEVRIDITQPAGDNAMARKDWLPLLKKTFDNPTDSYDGGDRYRGQYNDGRDGYGAYWWKENDEFFFGKWENGSRNGMAILFIPSDSRYVTGCPDCHIYVGYYSNSNKSGKGTCYDKNGNLLYYGDFSNGSPTETYPSTGDYSIYKFECIEYTDGSMYVGETKDGKRHGQGIYLWSSGSSWFGPWSDGSRKGFGLYMPHSGSVQYGYWDGDTYTEY